MGNVNHKKKIQDTWKELPDYIPSLDLYLGLKELPRNHEF